MVALMAIALTASPALAYGSDSGTAVCGSNYIAVRSKTIKDWYVQMPSGSTIDSGYTATWSSRNTVTLQSGTKTWRVLSFEGDVDAPGTYAYCWGQ